MTTRRGRRARAGSVVVHHLSAATPSTTPAQVGYVVGKAVGNSVVRHRVARRLRAQTVPWLADLAPGSRTVVRALPAAATATSDVLRQDLDGARRRLASAGATR